MNYEQVLLDFDPTIIKLAKTYHIEPLEWQDIAQELRLHLWLKKGKYDEKRRFDNWAYITCKNKIRDLAKKYNKQIKIISLDALKENGFDIEG